MEKEKILITIPEAMERYTLSRKPVVRLATEAGALYRLGEKILRIDAGKMDEYVRSLRA